MTDSKQTNLYYKLLSLGNVALLKGKYMVIPNEVKKTIAAYQQHFKPYNPRKTGYNRYGLSITSKDGGFSGIPDLDSLVEYNRLNGTNFNEPDFRKWTPFFKNCVSLQEAISPFQNYMGRSHILRLDKGGFFPTHRDISNTSFRLFISLCNNENYVFILDEKRVFFQPGRLYFFNSLLCHSLFSFVDQSLFVVFNIDLCREAVITVFKNLSAR